MLPKFALAVSLLAISSVIEARALRCYSVTAWFSPKQAAHWHLHEVLQVQVYQRVLLIMPTWSI